MNCLNCGKELEQVSGKKSKETCNDACRMAYRRQQERELQSKANKPEHQIRTQFKSEHKSEHDLIVVDGSKSYVIKNGNLRVPERDKKGVLTGNEVYALSADAVASDLASQKIASYPRDGLDLGMEVW